MNPFQVAAELDAMHARAMDAFERRDLSEYREFFAPDLSFRQADGRVIGRDQLMRDVESQFRQLGRFRSSAVREGLEVEGDRATVVIAQTASADATAFFVLHWTWEVTRKARYACRKEGVRWLIEAVDVLEERVTRGPFALGFRPRRAPSSG
jgi:hypothetical protein